MSQNRTYQKSARLRPRSLDAIVGDRFAAAVGQSNNYEDISRRFGSASGRHWFIQRDGTSRNIHSSRPYSRQPGFYERQNMKPKAREIEEQATRAVFQTVRRRRTATQQESD